MAMLMEKIDKAVSMQRYLDDNAAADIFLGVDTQEAISYFREGKSFGTLANLILSNVPNTQRFGLLIASELGSTPTELIEKILPLRNSKNYLARWFLLDAVRLGKITSQEACQLIERTLGLSNEEERLRAILFLLEAEEGTLLEIINISVGKRFGGVGELLEFEADPYFYSLDSLEDQIDRNEYHFYEKIKERSIKVAIMIKTGSKIDEVEAKVDGESSFIFDSLRRKTYDLTTLDASFLDSIFS